MSVSKDLYEFITTVVEDKIKDLKVTREEYDELKKSLRQLTESVNLLVQSQRRSEERLNRVEAAVEKLAEAQRRTEQQVRELAVQVGRLADTVGFTLEDIARSYLPPYLEHKFGIVTDTEELRQHHVQLEDDEVREIDAWGTGVTKDGKRVHIMVSCKSRIHITDVTQFDGLVKRICEKERIPPDAVIKIVFGYHINLRAKKEAERRKMIAITPYIATKIFR